MSYSLATTRSNHSDELPPASSSNSTTFPQTPLSDWTGPNSSRYVRACTTWAYLDMVRSPHAIQGGLKVLDHGHAILALLAIPKGVRLVMGTVRRRATGNGVARFPAEQRPVCDDLAHGSVVQIAHPVIHVLRERF